MWGIFCCWKPLWEYLHSTYIAVNGQKYKLIRLLAESPLTKTYKVFDERSKCFYNLKEIICPFGNIDSISEALTEIDNYKILKSKSVIPLLDTQIITKKDSTKLVYILLPYYPMGSLQDLINKNLLENNKLSKREIVNIMRGVLEGLTILHDPQTRLDITNKKDLRFDDVSITYSDNASNLLEGTPLEMNLLLNSDSANLNRYAHMNIKPSTVLFNDEEKPIITQLGSCLKMNRICKNELEIIQLQKWVNENCSKSYLPPELLQINLNQELNSSIDIWSFGCTIYTLLFGINPFEREEQIDSMPLKYHILTGTYSFPKRHRYSIEIVDIIKLCLQKDHNLRPTAAELIDQLMEII